MSDIHWSEITPHSAYVNRRRLMKGAGALAATAALGACGVRSGPGPDDAARAPAAAPGATAGSGAADAPAAAPTAAPEAIPTADELGDALTPFEDVTGYNNFYEFSTDKEAVARLAEGFVTSPWQVEVGGLVANPQTFDIDDLRTRFDQEDRVYRLRCVEGWSMVIPWRGFPLRALLEIVEPTSDAQYVRFESVYRPKSMPGQRDDFYAWPYVEGLHIGEAMHDLALLATGLYGAPLPPQNGAPVRLVVPWKYGFKSIKSIVKIDLVAEQPTSLWMAAAPNEYGFYANVNPEVPHPRWSQSSERRIGELRRRETLMFNGYADQVANLYAGMDLETNF